MSVFVVTGVYTVFWARQVVLVVLSVAGAAVAAATATAAVKPLLLFRRSHFILLSSDETFSLVA